MSGTPLVDDAARAAASSDLASCLFIEAGAGTGKSSTLVSRILNTLRERPEVPIESIVAITFTERAGGELRHRLRTGLEQALRTDPDNPALRTALDHLDNAIVGTIHSFAQHLLRTHALSAGLPLGFTVISGAQARQARTARIRRAVETWSDTLDGTTITTLAAYDLGPTDLIPLLEATDDAALRLSDAAFDQGTGDHRAECTEVADQLNELLKAARAACGDPSDKLMGHIEDRVPALIDRLRRAELADLAREHAALTAATVYPPFSFGPAGGKAAWGEGGAKEWRDRFKAMEPLIRQCVAGPMEEAVRRAMSVAWGSLKQVRREQIAAGEVGFDDLLRLARDLLQQDRAVRAHAHHDVRVLMVDEFQDTDPVQWDLIRLVTADPDDPAHSPLSGRLVVVGDPKQAIYSFRGANVGTYLMARAQFHGAGSAIGRIERLTTNFRSVAPVLDWVNAVFSAAMAASAHQVDYIPLDIAHRPHHADPGPAVTVVRAAVGSEDKVTELEPRLIADRVRAAITQQWQVTTPDPEGRGRSYTRPAQFSDIAILYPARTGVPALLDALDAAGVPYRSADAGIVLTRPVVMGLLAALDVVNDPTAQLDLWLALKSPLFACGDDDLLHHRQSGGGWSIFGEQPEGRVGAAMAMLRELNRRWTSPRPADVIDALVTDTHIMESLAFTPRGSFDADCLRMIRAHAHAWQDEGGVGLADFSDAISDVRADGSRASLAEPDDRDDNAVRLMTVFQAKGLEFPIVALAGMSHQVHNPAPRLAVVAPDHYEFQLSGGSASRGYGTWDEQERLPAAAAERMRVAYVACTRARDHLIISMCGEDDDARLRHARVLAGHVARGASDVTVVEGGSLPAVVRPDLPPLPADWVDTVVRVRSRSEQPWIAAPSGAGAAALGVSVESGDWEGTEVPTETLARRQRGGARLGSAVHAVLDLAVRQGGRSDVDLAIDVAHACAAENIPQQVDEVAARVRAALNTPLMVEALASPRRWPELYLSTPVDHGGVHLVEGFADLVFEAADGLVIVDYKTDGTLTPETRRHYAEQIAAYAAILERITGREVTRRLILHLPGGSQAQVL